LGNARTAAYVTGAGLKRLVQFVREEVAPARNAARETFRLCRVDGVFDVHAWTETLPHVRDLSPDETQAEARRVVRETLALCAEETRRAIETLIACDMVASAAAETMGMPRSTFRTLRDARWFPDFREHCHAR